MKKKEIDYIKRLDKIIEKDILFYEKFTNIKLGNNLKNLFNIAWKLGYMKKSREILENE